MYYVNTFIIKDIRSYNQPPAIKVSPLDFKFFKQPKNFPTLITPHGGMVIYTQDINFSTRGMVINTQDTNYSNGIVSVMSVKYIPYLWWSN